MFVEDVEVVHCGNMPYDSHQAETEAARAERLRVDLALRLGRLSER